MRDSQSLFESITKLDGLETVPIVLLFNKFDLLGQRMIDHPIVDYYPDYSGDPAPSNASRFFAAKFLELDRRPHGSLRIRMTSAVDYDDFKSVVDELGLSLFEHGLTIIPEKDE